MIRLFVIVGIVAIGLVSYFATYGQSPEYQMSPAESLLKQFEADGVVPNANALFENEEVEHGIFEVPPEDEIELEKAMSLDGMDMGAGGTMNMDADQPTGMAMGDDAPEGANMDADQPTGMAMSDDAPAGTNMDADQPTGMAMGDDAPAGTNMDADQPTGMAMGDDAPAGTNMDADQPTGMAMGDDAPAGMNSDADQPTGMAMGDDAPAGMNTDADQPTGMAMGDDAPADMNMSSGDAMEMEVTGGLVVTENGSFDREIDLTMSEWTFSDMNIEVKQGERIRFNVTNGGKIPHEFMFMTPPAMAAVNYRAQRADWNLLEHEALFEKSLVLPGGTFSFVAEIGEDGAWMFMCMLPYHMQMGMMGQMATPGNAMNMQM